MTMRTIFFGSLLAVLSLAEDPSRAVKEKRAADLMARGRLVEAEPLLVELLEEADAFPPGDTRRALVLNNLGSLYLDLGQYRKAEYLLHRAAAEWQSSCQECLPLASTLANLGAVFMQYGDFGKAEHYCRRALDMRRRKLGSSHILVARSLHNLARVKYQQRHYAEAESLCGQALAILEQPPAPALPETADVLYTLAAIRMATGRTAEALPYIERSVAQFERTSGAGSFVLAKPLHALGIIHAVAAHWTESESALKRALVIVESTAGPDHPLAGEVLTHYAGVLRKMKRKSEAKQAETRARAIEQRHSRENFLGHTVDVRSLR